MEELNIDTIAYNLLEMTKAEQAAVYEEAGAVIRAGGTVVFPTETVYGLGADALNPAAVAAIYRAKGRPSDNPLIIHVADYDLSAIVREIPPVARQLMELYWPGPLTIILKKQPAVPDVTTGSLDTVGVRMPDQEAALALIRASRRFIAAPSANISGRPSPTTFGRCVEDLDGRVDRILGMDPSRVGLESTIIDVTGEVPELLRPGAITREMLEAAIGPVHYQPGQTLKDDEAPRAPGMKYRHYAPKAKVTIFRGETGAVREAMLKRRAPGTLLLFIDGPGSGPFEGQAALAGRPGIIHFKSVEEAARAIFETMRTADDAGYGQILIQSVPETGLGLSLMNRVKKAAAYDIQEVASI